MSKMETAKLFNGKSQAVRLHKRIPFSGDEVYIKVGNTVMLFPKNVRETFLEGLNSFTDDILWTDVIKALKLEETL